MTILIQCCLSQDTEYLLLAEHLETLALDGLERLLARGRGGLAEYELRDERPRRREVPGGENLGRDERVVVLERRAEALGLERGPDDVLEDALEKRCVSFSATKRGIERRREGNVRKRAATTGGSGPGRGGTWSGAP